MNRNTPECRNRSLSDLCSGLDDALVCASEIIAADCTKQVPANLSFRSTRRLTGLTHLVQAQSVRHFLEITPNHSYNKVSRREHGNTDTVALYNFYWTKFYRADKYGFWLVVGSLSTESYLLDESSFDAVFEIRSHVSSYINILYKRFLVLVKDDSSMLQEWLRYPKRRLCH